MRSGGVVNDGMNFGRFMVRWWSDGGAHQSGAERSLDGTPVHSFGNFDFAVAMRYLLPPFRNLGFGALLNAGCALRQTQGRLSGISCPALSRSRHAKLVLE